MLANHRSSNNSASFMIPQASIDFEKSLSDNELRKSISRESRILERVHTQHANSAKKNVIQKQQRHNQHTLERVRKHTLERDKNADNVQVRNGTSTWMTLKAASSDSDISPGFEKFKKPTRHLSQIHTLQSYNKKDSPCLHKSVYYWISGCAVMDVFVWFVFMLVFTTTVQYTVLSAPEAENAITNQIREFIGGVEALNAITNEDQIFDWLKDTLIPSLTPTHSTSSIRKFTEYPTTLNTSSINGKLVVLENTILLRQSRCGQNCEGYEFNERWNRDSRPGGVLSHLETTEPFTLLKVNPAMSTQCQVLQTDPVTKYYDQKQTNNTNTSLQIRGITMNLSGGGYVERINLGLNIDANFALNTSNSATYDAALALTRHCAQEKVRVLRDSGWLDEKTRSLFVEFCIAPWYASFHNEKVRKIISERQLSDRWTVTAGACQRIVLFIDTHGYVVANHAIMTSPITLNENGEEEETSTHRRNMFFAVVSTCVIFSILKEITEIIFAFTNNERRYHYLNMNNMLWNILDVLIVFFLCMSLIRFPQPSETAFGEKSRDPNNLFPTYIRFSYINALEDSKWFFAWALFLWYIRGIEYFCLLPWFQLPILAMRKAFKNLAGFLVFFLFIMYGASITFRFFFGTASKEHSTIERSFTTLMKGSLGELSYEDVIADYRFFYAEILSIGWSFLAVFILLTMFVAIMEEGYQEAKDEIDPNPITDEKVIVTTTLNGMPFQYEGRVKKNNLDGTFNIKFIDPESNNKYIDCGIKKKNIHRVDVDNVEDGVLYAVLRYQLRQIQHKGWTIFEMSKCFQYVQSWIMKKKDTNKSEQDVSHYVMGRRKSNLDSTGNSSAVRVAPTNPPLPLGPVPNRKG